MHEERLRQNIDDGIRYWIKKPIVIIEENLMKRHKKSIKPDCHQETKENRQQHPPLQWSQQPPALVIFPKRSKKHETGDQRYEQYTIV